MTRVLQPRVLMLATLAIALTVPVAMAQRTGGGGGPGGPGGGRGAGGRPGGMMGGGMMGGGMMGVGMQGGTMGLIRNEAVQEEIELTDEQKKKLEELGPKLMAEMREMFSGMANFREMDETQRAAAREKMQAKGKELQASSLKQVNAILLPHQVRRVQQIEYQQAGPFVITREDVGEKLGLTTEQKTEIAELGQAVQEQMREMFAGGRPSGDMTEAREKMTKIRDENGKKVMGVLTAPQKKKLGELMGEPFDTEQLRGQGRSGPGRGGEGQQRGAGGRPQRPGAEGQRPQRSGGEGQRPRRPAGRPQPRQ